MQEATKATTECSLHAENVSHLPYLYCSGTVCANFVTIQRSQNRKRNVNFLLAFTVYHRSGNFRVKKLSYDKFSCKKIFEGMTPYHISVNSVR